jgi:hypothetical protein
MSKPEGYQRRVDGGQLVVLIKQVREDVSNGTASTDCFKSKSKSHCD